MCGRYVLYTPREQLALRFEFSETRLEWTPHYNIAPTQQVPAVMLEGGERRAGLYRWGLVPPWAKDLSGGARMINARSETIGERPAFRDAVASHRCLIPANGFYEWRRSDGKGSPPFFVRLRSGEVFAFAGLWAVWRSPAGAWVRSCCILTTRANELVAPIHDRMPVILRRDHEAAWLDVERVGPGELRDLLLPYPADALLAERVSALANNVTNDSPACIQPLDAAAQPALF